MSYVRSGITDENHKIRYNTPHSAVAVCAVRGVWAVASWCERDQIDFAPNRRIRVMFYLQDSKKFHRVDLMISLPARIS